VQPGDACAPQPQDPPRELNSWERELLVRALTETVPQRDLDAILARTTVVEECAGCATFYCREESDGRDHWPAGRELLGSDADGAEIFCIVFLDADGIWGADISRRDGQPWREIPDPAGFQRGTQGGFDRPAN
jgi:hypothetical protein